VRHEIGLDGERHALLAKHKAPMLLSSPARTCVIPAEVLPYSAFAYLSLLLDLLLMEDAYHRVSIASTSR
jgi:hypothetical protein